MTSGIKEKPFSLRWIQNYGLIIIGAFLIAIGYTLFITPYKIVPGGVYGIAIIIHHVFHLPVGTVALFFNIPITIIGVKVLGPRFGSKTVVGFLFTSFFLDSSALLLGPDPLKLQNEILMSVIYGGLVIGAGVGLLFRAQASCGGTDMVGMIISKITRKPVGQMMIFVDSAIVLAGFAVFRDWRIPLFSWTAIFVLGRTVDAVLQGFSYEKCVYIISNEHERIKDIILNNLNRSGTYLNGEGMFRGEPRKVIYTVLNRRELAILKDHIREIDPKAFITVTDGIEILGKGFKSLNDKVDN